jgi:hypothetical protein
MLITCVSLREFFVSFGHETKSAASFDHASGRMKNADRAKHKKTTPPTRVTVLGEMRCATKRPPITASPVHRPWPMVPPTMTPRRFSLAAKTMVVN